MTNNFNFKVNPYRQAAINAANRKKEEAITLANDNLLTDEQRAEQERVEYGKAITSQRKDTHSMQYSFYARKN